MALDHAALLEVLEAMQAGGVEDRVRTAAQTIYLALIDAVRDGRARERQLAEKELSARIRRLLRG